jgi:phosphoketolase
MIVLRSPKGWTCPKEIDGKKCEDSWHVLPGRGGEHLEEDHGQDARATHRSTAILDIFRPSIEG